MAVHYLEDRSSITVNDESRIADIVRHYHARQELGPALVVCDDAERDLQTASKQWQRLSRELQLKRGRSTNAVDILRYTYLIAQMQHLPFVTETKAGQPAQGLAFAGPKGPAQYCLYPTVYLAAGVAGQVLEAMATAMPPMGLAVSYEPQASHWLARHMQPHTKLEKQVQATWDDVVTFLDKHHIRLQDWGEQVTAEMMEDAVDTLLTDETSFLALAVTFQRTLNLARPLRSASKTQRRQYETLISLAHRVQTFAPGGFSPQFLSSYADDDFLMRDAAAGLAKSETWERDIRRHLEAGRLRLAAAMMRHPHARSAGKPGGRLGYFVQPA